MTDNSHQYSNLSTENNLCLHNICLLISISRLNTRFLLQTTLHLTANGQPYTKKHFSAGI